jgi:hypothetical protein
MAWTSPKTFVAGRALTASELNTHLRDNMLEMAAAKAPTTNQNSYFVVDKPNHIIARRWAASYYSSTISTSSTEFTDVTASPGPVCTATTGTIATVFLTAQAENSSAGQAAIMGFTVTRVPAEDAENGEQEEAYIAADVHRCLRIKVNSAAQPQQFSNFIVLDNLVPGENIFQAKYRTENSGTATFLQRRLIVLPRN